MRKSVHLKVSLVVEGDDEPAHDFASSSADAVRDILAAGRWRHPSLKVTVKDVAEQTDEDEGPPS
ncbi:MAG TPA: hypothetical protein VHU19_15805 [Pyrinomonadaceae bacterium]|jgi:hypothetical protein|nr:hypothetical protein [Pyrinomonadaceae bacterium]